MRACKSGVIVFLLYLMAPMDAVHPFALTNFNRSYDVTYRFLREDDVASKAGRFSVSSSIEGGRSSDSYNFDTESSPLLELYQQTQSSIAMLLGAKESSPIHELAMNIAPATDDGVRGHFKLRGDYTEINYDLGFHYDTSFQTLPGHFVLSGHFPVSYRTISGVTWIDQTKDVTGEDLDVKKFVTGDIFSLAASLGELDLSNWHKTGLSDVSFMLAWYNVFKHVRRNLKTVRVTGRVGVSVPTGALRDEDSALSMPLGNDGAFAIPFSGALDLQFAHNIMFGVEAEFLKLMDEARTRRLKTDERQTDFLLLHKGRARKSYGFAWKFNLYLGVYRFLKKFSACVAYQHYKRDNDKLHSRSHNFDDDIINTSQTLEEKSFHNLLFKIDYGFGNSQGVSLEPRATFFYKLPINAQRCVVTHTFGGQLTLLF